MVICLSLRNSRHLQLSVCHSILRGDGRMNGWLVASPFSCLRSFLVELIPHSAGSLMRSNGPRPEGCGLRSDGHVSFGSAQLAHQMARFPKCPHFKMSPFGSGSSQWARQFAHANQQCHRQVIPHCSGKMVARRHAEMNDGEEKEKQCKRLRFVVTRERLKDVTNAVCH